jgi:hypothetical protein
LLATLDGRGVRVGLGGISLGGISRALGGAGGLAGLIGLRIHFSDPRLVLLGPLLRLFELRGEALHLRVDLAHFAANELLCRARRGAGPEHYERNDEQ